MATVTSASIAATAMIVTIAADRYDRRYYRNYDRRNNYRCHNNRRCDNGTGGTIIGAIAGGLLGHEVIGRRGDKHRTLSAVW